MLAWENKKSWLEYCSGLESEAMGKGTSRKIASESVSKGGIGMDKKDPFRFTQAFQSSHYSFLKMKT